MEAISICNYNFLLCVFLSQPVFKALTTVTFFYQNSVNIFPGNRRLFNNLEYFSL